MRRDPLKCVFLLISLIPLTFILFNVSNKPVVLPFVDDWILVPWLLNDIEVSYENTFSLINGHQYALMKMLLLTYGNLFGVNLFPILLFGIFIAYLAMLGTLTLMPRDIKLDVYSLILGTYIILCVFSFRQFQNIFMIICIPWIISLFFIVRFANNMRTLNSNSSLNRMLAYAVIACFTSGLGMILGLYALLVFAILPTHFWSKLTRVSVMLITIFVTFVLPQLDWLMKTPSPQSNSPVEMILSVFELPLESFRFVTTLIAQPQIPWRYSYLDFSVFAGAAIFLVAVISSAIQIHNEGARKFILSNPFLLIGSLFIAILFVTRFRALGALGALEPRYTTGSIVLLIGVLFQILSTVEYKNKILAICLCISLFGILLSNSSGLNYYFDRYAQQNDIIQCFEEDKWKISSGDCYDKIASLSLGVEPTKLIDYIGTFLAESGLKR